MFVQVIDENEKQMMFEVEDASRRAQQTVPAKGKARRTVEVKTILDEAQHVDPTVQSHMNALDAILTRKEVRVHRFIRKQHICTHTNTHSII